MKITWQAVIAVDQQFSTVFLERNPQGKIPVVRGILVHKAAQEN